MNFTKYPFILMMAFSLVFVGGVEAKAGGKHGSDKARARVMKEVSKHTSFNTKSSTIKKAK